MDIINDDGSVQGKKFSKGYTGEYPRPKPNETYRQYHKRVDECKEKGFHLGDLSWSDWDTYCKGSGTYQDFDSSELIGY